METKSSSNTFLWKYKHFQAIFEQILRLFLNKLLRKTECVIHAQCFASNSREMTSEKVYFLPKVCQENTSDHKSTWCSAVRRFKNLVVLCFHFKSRPLEKLGFFFGKALSVLFENVMNLVKVCCQKRSNIYITKTVINCKLAQLLIANWHRY